MSLSSPILTSDTDGVKFAKLQRLVRLALDNASISYTMSGLLTPILPSDTQGVKWAKLGRWMQELATNITGGGGGGGVTSIVAGSGISVNAATGAVTVTATGLAANNYAAVANNAGNTTITPDKSDYTVGLTVGGAARTSVIILDTTGRTAGDKIAVIATLPATVGINLQFRNATAGGALLLPAATFASQQYDTDGVDLSATFVFVYTGSAWIYDMSKIPA